MNMKGCMGCLTILALISLAMWIPIFGWGIALLLVFVGIGTLLKR